MSEGDDLDIAIDSMKHSEPSVRKFFEDISGYSQAPNRHIDAAKLFVVGANAAYVADIPDITPEEQQNQELTVEQLYVVMFSYVLGSWKALISTSVPGDGLYFEVIHNEEKQETYVDIYKKQANHMFSHHDH